MSIRFTILNEKKPDYRREEIFSQDVITIGRDESNNMVLEDKRKSVSRKHAEIRLDEGIYFLVDLGSRNGTFINNYKVNPNHPYALEHGSEIAIGDYVLTISMQTTPEGESPNVKFGYQREATVFVSNPFLDDVKNLVSTLERLNEKYEIEDPAMRRDYLVQALGDMLQAQIETEAVKLLVNVCGGEKAQKPRSSSAQLKKTQSDRSIEHSHITGTVLELFLGVFIKMRQIFTQFHTEFIGTTRIDTEESLHTKTIDELKEYFFSPTLEPELSKKRIELLKLKTEELNVHQVALLDGYRSSVHDGVREMLREINPAIIKNRISQEKLTLGPLHIPVAFIPLYAELKTLKELQLKHFEFSSEDRGIIERKHFRPAFSKRYLESMGGGKK
jgi:hypothetical protein